MSDFSAPNSRYESLYRKESDSDEKKIRIIKIVFFVLCFLLLVEAAVYKCVMPARRLPKISFMGLHSYTQEQLLQTLEPLSQQNWLRFDSAQAVSILSSVSAIESVSVVKHFPDTVVISIVERSPVALTFVSKDNRSIPVQIDKNGVLFSTSGEKSAIDGSVPIISGLPIEHLNNGMRIPVKYRNLIDRITEIQNLPQKYFAAISEICVIPKEYGNFELVLFPANSHVRVLTDRALTIEALQYMMVVLDVVKSIDPEISEIDLRYGSVSYRK